MGESFVGNVLATGQLAAAQAAMFTVDPIDGQRIGLITLFNTNTVVQTVTVKLVKKNKTAVTLSSAPLQPGSTRTIELPLLLQGGDAIWGDDGGVGAKIDFMITGLRAVRGTL